MVSDYNDEILSSVKSAEWDDTDSDESDSDLEVDSEERVYDNLQNFMTFQVL